MLRIRLSMGGVRKRPIYKIVVADGRYPRDGKFIEKLGSYNPLLPKDKKERIKVEFERIKYWISKGAQPTLRVSRILGEMKLMPMPKAGNNPLKAVPKKDWPEDEEYLASIKNQWVEPFGDMRQELVFIGQGLDQEKMMQKLDECLLTEEEVLQGREYWETLKAPFPGWVQILILF